MAACEASEPDQDDRESYLTGLAIGAEPRGAEPRAPSRGGAEPRGAEPRGAEPRECDRAATPARLPPASAQEEIQPGCHRSHDEDHDVPDEQQQPGPQVELDVDAHDRHQAVRIVVVWLEAA